MTPSLQFLEQQGLLPSYVTKEAAAGGDVNDVPASLCINGDPDLPANTQDAVFKSMLHWHSKNASAPLPEGLIKVATAFGIAQDVKAAHAALCESEPTTPEPPTPTGIAAVKFAAFIEDHPVYPCAHAEELRQSCNELEKDLLEHRLTSFEAAKVASTLVEKSASLGVRVSPRIARLGLDPNCCFDYGTACAELETVFKRASVPVEPEVQEFMREALAMAHKDASKIDVVGECFEELALDAQLDLRHAPSTAELLRDPAMHQKVTEYYKSAVFLNGVAVPVDAILAHRTKATDFMSEKTAAAFRTIVEGADVDAATARENAEKLPVDTQSEILHLLARL